LIASVDQHEIASVVKTLNKKLNEANLVKNQFIAVMNHEIRTPLNAIIGFSDLMLGKPSETDQLEYSGRIKRNGKILLHLIEDLLDLSKIEADCLEVESHSFDLRQIFDDVHSMLSPVAVAKGITLEWDVDSSLPVSVITDSIRFKQILTNIIGNALKFSTLGFVKVFVTATEDRNDFQILVSDSGGGIAEENREKIFQPFPRPTQR
jgi:signal transduction histidine kinase